MIRDTPERTKPRKSNVINDSAKMKASHGGVPCQQGKWIPYGNDSVNLEPLCGPASLKERRGVWLGSTWPPFRPERGQFPTDRMDWQEDNLLSYRH